MDESTLAIMTRMDSIRDNVVDIKIDVSEISNCIQKHESRLENLEDMTEGMGDVLNSVSNDLRAIKNGPVYSLDRFITKRVAQVTGGVGVFGIFAWYIITLLF